MDFGEVLNRAWQIIWKHKILWLFGILASCGRQGANFSGSSSRSSGSSNFGDGSLPPGMEEFALRVQQFFEGIPEETYLLVFIGLICVGLLAAVISFVLSAIGRAGLIKGTVQVEEGAEALSFGQLFQDIRPYLGRVLLLNLLVGLVVFAIVVIFVVLFSFAAVLTFGIAAICLIPLVCLFVPVAIAVGVIVEQANVALVVDDLPIGEALQRGWLIVRHNLSTYFVMTLILLIGGGVVSFVISLPLAFVAVPVFAGLLFGSEVAITGGLALAALCFVVYLPVLLVAGGILQAYIESAWTLTYMRLGDAAIPA
jgi:hypothetical protein